MVDLIGILYLAIGFLSGLFYLIKEIRAPTQGVTLYIVLLGAFGLILCWIGVPIWWISERCFDFLERLRSRSMKRG